jgi:hypothetical protein
MVDRQPLASWNDGAVKSAILDFVALRQRRKAPSSHRQPSA